MRLRGLAKYHPDCWACGVTVAWHPIKVAGVGSNPTRSILLGESKGFGLDAKTEKPANGAPGCRPVDNLICEATRLDN